MFSVKTKETSRKRRRENSEENDFFPIMELPVEVRGAIFNKLPQRAVPDLRLVCKKWAAEVDQLYEFSINLYDTTIKLAKVYNLRVRECTVWKFTVTLSTPTLFKHPNFLKILKITGPTSAQNLQMLISTADQLEQLTISRRGNFPWILNMNDTPELAKLTKLKYLRLNSEEHIMIRLNTVYYQQKSQFNVRQIPMMDCYFPSLKEFQIYKRFHRWNSNIFITHVLNFVARHYKTMKKIELNLTPLSYVSIPTRNIDSSSDDDAVNDDIPNRLRLEQPVNLCSREINMASLSSLKLRNFSVTTQGSPQDLILWMKILEHQHVLQELYFHWISNTIPEDDKSGVPWTYFRAPILNCADTLVSVEIVNLSMVVNTSCDNHREIRPFNLDIFRTCRQLKTLTLRCPENHANLPINVADAPANEQEPAEAEQNDLEQILMINGNDLPDSLESLEIAYFPMLTSDIKTMVIKCVNLKRLFLKDCGKSGNLGVTAQIVYHVSKLEQLKFLEIIGFNDSTEDNKLNLELVCLAIGFPYIEGDTWLEFNNGSSSAFESLKPIHAFPYLDFLE